MGPGFFCGGLRKPKPFSVWREPSATAGRATLHNESREHLVIPDQRGGVFLAPDLLGEDKPNGQAYLKLRDVVVNLYQTGNVLGQGK